MNVPASPSSSKVTKEMEIRMKAFLDMIEEITYPFDTATEFYAIYDQWFRAGTGTGGRSKARQYVEDLTVSQDVSNNPFLMAKYNTLISNLQTLESAPQDISGHWGLFIDTIKLLEKTVYKTYYELR